MRSIPPERLPRALLLQLFFLLLDGTRISPLVDGFRMFTEMLRVRWYSLTEKYDEIAPAQATAQHAKS